MCKKLWVSICLLFASALACAQDSRTNNLGALEELQTARDILVAAEAEFDRYSMELVEPIEQLANAMMALNQFEEADSLLDRAVQITRMNNGLHTPAQLSLIRKRIDNFSNRQAWDDAREQMNYLFTYYLRVPVLLNESLLEDFLVLTNQHLRGATEDSEIEQGRHLSRAYQLNWAMISTARKLYGDMSPSLVPYLYRQVQHLYLFKKGNEAGGRETTNANFYYTLNGRTRGWARFSTMDRFYQDGLRLLAQIRSIYSEHGEAYAEARAMSELYIGDWFMLFDHAGLATESYESAYESLLESGVGNERINALLSKPRILPVQQFFTSVDEAIQNLPGSVAVGTTKQSETNTHELTLVEWSADYPTLRSPTDSFSRSQTDSTHALLSFTLPAQNESTFLYKHRFRQSVGIAVDAEAIEGFRGIVSGSDLALRRLQQLRFRPVIVNGTTIQSHNRIRYEIAAET